MFLRPFHAAEQHSKERNSGSADHKMRLSETSSLYGQRREAEGQVNGFSSPLRYWFVSLCK